MATKIQIRFNTDVMKYPERDLPLWRVLIRGKETLARHVNLRVESWTTTDILDTGVVKHHITCNGEAVWEGDRLEVR